MGIVIRHMNPSDVRIFNISGNDFTPYTTARLSYDGGSNERPDEERLYKFLKMLFSNGHMVPFEHCSVTYEINAPIFVFRQLFRYRTTSISERSLRYCNANPEFYLPLFKSENNEKEYKKSIIDSYNTYLDLQKNEVPNEIARCVLPLSTYSSAYFTMNLRNLFHLWDQRLDSHAQKEIRQVAYYMFESITPYFPVISAIYKETDVYKQFTTDNPEYF